MFRREKNTRRVVVRICFLAYLFSAVVTQASAKVFVANNFASYKNAVDSVNARAGGDTIRITGNIQLPASGLIIEKDVAIIGDVNGDGTPKYTITGDPSFTAVDCKVTNFCAVENIRVVGAENGILIAVYPDEHPVIKVNNCIAENNQSSHWYGGNGIIIKFDDSQGWGYAYPSKITISNCIAEGNGRNGIDLESYSIQSEDITVSNCMANYNESSGISIGHNAHIRNCTAEENGSTGFQSGDNCVIEGCSAIRNGMLHGYGTGFSMNDNTIIRNSVALENAGSGFENWRKVQAINCKAIRNLGSGFLFSFNAVVNNCVSLYNVYNGFDGNYSSGYIISNSSAAYNLQNGFTSGGVVINCSFYKNGENGIINAGETGELSVYNSIIYDNNIDIYCQVWGDSIFKVYNTVYLTEYHVEYDVPSIAKYNCTTDDPKLLENGNYYNLGDNSSALYLADKNVIDREQIFEHIYDVDFEWLDSVFTENYFTNILAYDQLGTARIFNGDRYDAGSIAGNSANAIPDIIYNPKKGGNRGIVTVMFYGVFDNHVKFSLKRQGESDIIADTFVNGNDGKCYVRFDFNNKKTGLWNVAVDFGDTVITVKNGFEIEPYKEPKIEFDIISPVNIREDRWEVVMVKYANKGNADTSWIPVITEIITDTSMICAVRERWHYAVSDNAIQTAVNNGTLRNVETIRNPLKSDKNSTFITPLIPCIPAYSTGYLTLEVKMSNALNKPMEMRVFNLPFMSNGKEANKAGNKDYWKCMHMFLMYDKSTKSASLIPDSCSAQFVENAFASNGKIYNAEWEIAKVISDCASASVTWEDAAETAIEIISSASATHDKAAETPRPPSWGLPCPFFLLRYPGKTVSSHDPNDKYGPVSHCGSKWISDKEDFTYFINFENEETASAPAQEVWITDTLDLNVFDINTFEAGIIKIGDTIIETPPCQQDYTWSVDMRPKMNLITEINLQLDKVKGIAQWYFKSIDPDGLPLDNMAGFLPPNDSTGKGQAFVMFSVNLKSGLANNTVIANKASIVFDNNPAIITPAWVNKKDIISPASTMQQAVSINDSTIELRWQGTDNQGGSGVYCYDVYMKRGNDSYEKILANATITSTILKIEKNVKYAFYTIATDSAGNVENKTKLPDIQYPSETGVRELQSLQSAVLVPNPASTECTVSFGVEKSGQVSVSLTNMLGVNLMTIYEGYAESGNFKRTFDIHSLPAGVYAVRIRANNTVTVRKLLVVR